MRAPGLIHVHVGVDQSWHHDVVANVDVRVLGEITDATDYFLAQVHACWPDAGVGQHASTAQDHDVASQNRRSRFDATSRRYSAVERMSSIGVISPSSTFAASLMLAPAASAASRRGRR